MNIYRHNDTSIQSRRSRRRRPATSQALLRTTATTTTTTHSASKHTPQHVKHGITLPRYLDSKIRLPNLIQRLAPLYFLQMIRIVALQLPEETRVAALHAKQ